WWKINSTQIWENCCSSVNAWGLWKGGSRTTIPRALGANPGWRGAPNFSLWQERICPITCIWKREVSFKGLLRENNLDTNTDRGVGLKAVVAGKEQLGC